MTKLNHSLFCIIRNSEASGGWFIFSRVTKTRISFHRAYENGFELYGLKKENLETQFVYLVKNNISCNFQVTNNKNIKNFIASEGKRITVISFDNFSH